MRELTARWMFADSGLFSRRGARRNPLRWSCQKRLDAVCVELAMCGPELRARPVRVRLAGGPQGVSEEMLFHGTQAAVLHLRQLSQLGAGAGARAAEGARAPSPIDRARTKPPFRFEDRTKIPDALVEGPFERFEIAEDVYSTAYLIARNATEDMYSIWPWANPQVRVVWLYLFFIVGSQLFVMVIITVFYPPIVDKEALFVDCANSSSLVGLVARGLIEAAEPEHCRSAGSLSFLADVHGSPVAYYSVEIETPFFDSVLAEGSPVVYLLRVICCSWVFSQMYFQHFSNVCSLIAYHDFSRWFLPLKGMEARNNWAIGIAFMQYFVLLVVTTTSFVIIFAQRDPFDIVMNSLAFTFIAEVGSYFNNPLVKHMAATQIDGLPEGYGEIYYLYPEYLESNAVREDGSYTDEGWYILEEEEKAGLLSDYQVKHNPNAYPHPSTWQVSLMSGCLVFMPMIVTLLVATRGGGGLSGLYARAAAGAEL